MSATTKPQWGEVYPKPAGPFVKWAGGKRALAAEILRRLPEKIGTYYEPFVGGGAIFFALAAEKRFKRAVLADINKELENAYVMVAAQPSAVIAALRKLAAAHSEEHFYRIRALDPEPMAAVPRAARFMYLNRTCFNGLYRVNKKGGFNVPFGKYANPTICDEANLDAVSAALAGVKVVACHFEQAAAAAKKDDAVYFDPPYMPVSDTSSFTAYAKGGFGPVEQIRLRDAARRLAGRGVHVLLSNADVPAVRALYAKGFKIERVEAPRRINSKGGKRGNVGELLITGRTAR